MAVRPNILLLISDEHSPRTLGCYGADFVQTPNLDRLAASGTTFDNAYCSYALCVPSRNALMSGLECHRIRAYDNGSPLPSDLPTWAHMLVDAGYRTVLDGKMHFLGADQLHGFEEHWHEQRTQIGGFRWGEENPSGDGYKAFSRIHLVDNPEKHETCREDVCRTAAAVDFLDHVDRTRPFCLTVGHIFPHYPMICSRRVFEQYADVDIPEPVRGDWLHPRNEHFGNRVWGFDKFTTDETRASRRAYLSMVTMLDAWIGEILDSLERNGLARDTIVIYTTDHGDMWGEHGMWGKNMFYEDSARVPLIVAGESFGIAAGRRIATPVSLLDLYPTLRDMAGVRDWNVPLDGHSLWGALSDGDAVAERPVFCGYYGSDTKGPERMVRFGRHKLNYYHGQGVEMFDLEADPNELVNCADDPACRTAREQLTAMILEGWDPERIAIDIRAAQNRRAYIGRSLRRTPGAQQRWAI